VAIDELEHDEFVGGPAVHIGIFLSIFNCHLNRAPVAGRVVGLRYRAGKYLNALRPESARLNEQLNNSKYESAMPRYAIVIPVKKTAHWWNMTESERLHEIEVHTQKSLAYMRCVKRELYYSTGLDEQDFITYFETADLQAFHELNAALAGIRENEFQIRCEHVMLLGAIRSISETVRLLSRQPAPDAS